MAAVARPAFVLLRDHSDMTELRTFMFERVYLGPAAAAAGSRPQAVVRSIFGHLIRNGATPQDATDYVAGMTDRFALAFAAEL